MNIEHVEKRVIEYVHTPDLSDQNRVTVSEVEVCWNMAGVLRANDQRRLFTRNQNVCYVLFGETKEGDVLLGHFYPRTHEDSERSILRNAVRFANLDQDRRLSLEDFTLERIEGHVLNEKMFIADISYQN